jgi:hypothetical protein
MEPLTTIELRACKWLGILALAASAAAELYALARTRTPCMRHLPTVKSRTVARAGARARDRRQQ